MPCEIYARFDGLSGPELRLRFRHRLRFRLETDSDSETAPASATDSDSKDAPASAKRFRLKSRTRFANSVPFGGSIRFGLRLNRERVERKHFAEIDADRNFGRSRLRHGLFRRIFADSRKVRIRAETHGIV